VCFLYVEVEFEATNFRSSIAVNSDAFLILYLRCGTVGSTFASHSEGTGSKFSPNSGYIECGFSWFFISLGALSI
jgi:hypothetical protein